MMVPKPGDSFGRYDILRRLGRGGMGVVFAALHRDLQREVALKVLAPDLSDDSSYRNRFLREAQALARLDSPHVVRVFDAGEHEGWLYIATELVPDGDLAELLRRTGPLPVPEAVGLVAQVATGLAVAHDAGILHRDIKPSNVLLRRLPDGSLRAVLCDFGIAAVADADHTATVGVIGTPGYMAPERHDGGDASVASDVYSLGCLLWALLSGEAPYVGSAAQVLMGHLQGPVPQLAGGSADERAVNGVLLRAMAKDPRERPRSATAMVEDMLARPVSSRAEAQELPEQDVLGDTVISVGDAVNSPDAAVAATEFDPVVVTNVVPYRASEGAEPTHFELVEIVAADDDTVQRPRRWRALVALVMILFLVGVPAGFGLTSVIRSFESDRRGADGGDPPSKVSAPVGSATSRYRAVRFDVEPGSPGEDVVIEYLASGAWKSISAPLALATAEGGRERCVRFRARPTVGGEDQISTELRLCGRAASKTVKVSYDIWNDPAESDALERLGNACTNAQIAVSGMYCNVIPVALGGFGSRQKVKIKIVDRQRYGGGRDCRYGQCESITVVTDRSGRGMVNLSLADCGGEVTIDVAGIVRSTPTGC